jgi:hypothetical protein
MQGSQQLPPPPTWPKLPRSQWSLTTNDQGYYVALVNQLYQQQQADWEANGPLRF